MVRKTIVRPFDGSLADAEELLAVERETFNESPYSPTELQAMLSAGPQRAWVAVGGDSVVGFVVAFVTNGLRGPCWEIDLLAVHPQWTRLGLATRLIRAASATGATVSRRARAVVAKDNPASVRAFARAGYRVADTCELFIVGLEGLELHSRSTLDITIRQAADLAEARDWLPVELAVDDVASVQEQHGFTLLLAEAAGQPAGYAELIEVQTILYRGVWIESQAASSPVVCQALVHNVLDRAMASGLDEVGAMVPQGDQVLRETLLARGFKLHGEFHWLAARLPLPGLATPPQPSSLERSIRNPVGPSASSEEGGLERGHV